ncbi:YdeI/OmpD-associated family protein [Reyranella sp. CPCC 100927]|nr:YdeI/OmpD-associated family protein [Reyranella sp. CPCC 100927]
MPAAVRAALEQAGLVDTYRNRPPYQRNDYLMWINKAKLDATRRKRLTQMLDELKAGDVYMGMAWRAASRGRH